MCMFFMVHLLFQNDNIILTWDATAADVWNCFVGLNKARKPYKPEE